MANNKGLYHPSYEHDACGIGFVANIKGNKSHAVISDALTILENMEQKISPHPTTLSVAVCRSDMVDFISNQC